MALRAWALASTLSVMGPPVWAQQRPEPCLSAAAAEFDFWLGSWTIEQSIAQTGSNWRQFPAHTTVTKELGGCGLLERWHGTVLFPWEGMTAPAVLDAVSVRTVDPDGQWTIHWIDSRTRRFGPPYRGRFERGLGTFYATLEPRGGDGARTFGRITFDRGAGPRVLWELSISSDSATWQPIWRMRMTRPSR